MCYKLRIPTSLRLPNFFNAFLFKPFFLNHFCRNTTVITTSLPGPDAEFGVKVILNVMQSRGKLFYPGGCKGLGPKEGACGPLEKINAPALIHKFYLHCVHKKKGHKVGYCHGYLLPLFLSVIASYMFCFLPPRSAHHSSPHTETCNAPCQCA